MTETEKTPESQYAEVQGFQCRRLTERFKKPEKIERDVDGRSKKKKKKNSRGTESGGRHIIRERRVGGDCRRGGARRKIVSHA